MTGDDMRQAFEVLLSPEEIERPYAQFGGIKRQRTPNLDMLMQAKVISAGTSSEAYQANVRRSYVGYEAPWVTCSAFCRWFDEPLERRMEAPVDRPLKSVPRSDHVDAEPPFTVITRLHASLIASIIAALLAHTHNVKARPRQIGAPWTKAPLHPRRLALQFSVSCQFIVQAFDLKGAEWRWERMAELLTYAGRDANRRRRPSVLDQLRGRKRQPAV